MSSPKEIKEYKDKMKKLPFKERMIEYFSISSVYDKDPDEKKSIIKSTFTKKEEAEYYRTYSPIMMAIEAYNDRVRTLKINADYYSYFISTQLRKRDNLDRITEFLNKVIEVAEKEKAGLVKTEGESPSKMIDSVLSMLSNYKDIDIERNIPLSFEGGRYQIDDSTLQKKLTVSTGNLRRILEALKSYILSLKEFLETINHIELFPREFKDYETWMINLFRGEAYYHIVGEIGEGERSFLALDYYELKPIEKIFGEGNLWLKAYYSELKD